MKVLPYKNLTILYSSRKGHDDRWIPEAWVEVPTGDQVTSYRVPIDSKNFFPTEPEAEAEAEKQARAWIDWIYPSASAKTAEGFNDFTSPFFDKNSGVLRPRPLVVSLLDDEECFEACMSV